MVSARGCRSVSISRIIDQLIIEDGRPAYQIADAANISGQLLHKYRYSKHQQPWDRLEKVLDVLGYELEVVVVRK